jgi:uncharacterized membrane protein YkvA (DUF1232 family)
VAFFFLLRRIFSVAHLMQHPAVPTRLKALPVIAFIYLIFPRDLILDLRPFGVLDDMVVLSILLGIFINKGRQYVGLYDKGKSDAIDADFQVLMQEEDHPTEEPGGDPPSATPPPSAGPPAAAAPGDNGAADDDTPHEDLRNHQ